MFNILKRLRVGDFVRNRGSRVRPEFMLRSAQCRQGRSHCSGRGFIQIISGQVWTYLTFLVSRFCARTMCWHLLISSLSITRKYAFERMAQSGAFLTTAESLVFQLCKDAKHPKFKEIQKFIAAPSHETSLLKF